MDTELKNALLEKETDLNGVLQRFCNDEELYVSCLKEFLRDTSMDDLDAAMEHKRWEDAFTSAHAIKGLVGNMGFVPLFRAASDMVLLFRTGRTEECGDAYTILKNHYIEMKELLLNYFGEK